MSVYEGASPSAGLTPADQWVGGREEGGARRRSSLPASAASPGPVHVPTGQATDLPGVLEEAEQIGGGNFVTKPP